MIEQVQSGGTQERASQKPPAPAADHNQLRILCAPKSARLGLSESVTSVNSTSG